MQNIVVPRHLRSFMCVLACAVGIMMTSNHHIIGNQFTFDRRGLTDGQQMGADVALYRAFDLNIAGGFHVTRDV